MIKYPRTFHLPFSKGTVDDKALDSIDSFLNKEIVVTETLDGSNFCMTSKNCYARSSCSHEGFSKAKALHDCIRSEIPENQHIFMEYCAVKHSCNYDKIPLCNVFGILEDDIWLSYDDVLLYASLLDLPTVPQLFRGTVSSEPELKALVLSLMNSPLYGEQEGVVIRLASSFPDKEFSTSVAKSVRLNHVNTGIHWTKQNLQWNNTGV